MAIGGKSEINPLPLPPRSPPPSLGRGNARGHGEGFLPGELATLTRRIIASIQGSFQTTDIQLGGGIVRIMITGSSGFSGSRTALYLAHQKNVDQVIGVDCVGPKVFHPKLESHVVDLDRKSVV